MEEKREIRNREGKRCERKVMSRKEGTGKEEGK